MAKNRSQKIEKVHEDGRIRYKYNINIDYLSLFELIGHGQDFGYKMGIGYGIKFQALVGI